MVFYFFANPDQMELQANEWFTRMDVKVGKTKTIQTPRLCKVRTNGVQLVKNQTNTRSKIGPSLFQGWSGGWPSQVTWSTHSAGRILAGKEPCRCLDWKVIQPVGSGLWTTMQPVECDNLLDWRLKEGKPDGVWWLCLEGGAWLVGEVPCLALQIQFFKVYLRLTTEGHFLGTMWLFCTRWFPLENNQMQGLN